jgi:hypothetical protein
MHFSAKKSSTIPKFNESSTKVQRLISTTSKPKSVPAKAWTGWAGTTHPTLPMNLAHRPLEGPDPPLEWFWGSLPLWGGLGGMGGGHDIIRGWLQYVVVFVFAWPCIRSPWCRQCTNKPTAPRAYTRPNLRAVLYMYLHLYCISLSLCVYIYTDI